MFTTARSSRSVSLTQELSAIRARALQKAASLGWRVKRVEDCQVHFTVGLSWQSWGENVLLTLAPNSATITSSCRCVTQVFAWEKNDQNCEALARALQQPAA